MKLEKMYRISVYREDKLIYQTRPVYDLELAEKMLFESGHCTLVSNREKDIEYYQPHEKEFIIVEELMGSYCPVLEKE